MKSVRDLLAAKPHDIWHVTPESSVLDALALLAEKDTGAVLVCEDKRPVGIFSERDYARKIILQGKASKDTPVREVMTQKVVYVTPDRTIEECMALMTEKRIRHLPVLERGEVIGIISIGDVVKAVIGEKDFLIEQLEKYITS